MQSANSFWIVLKTFQNRHIFTGDPKYVLLGGMRSKQVADKNNSYPLKVVGRGNETLKWVKIYITLFGAVFVAKAEPIYHKLAKYWDNFTCFWVTTNLLIMTCTRHFRQFEWLIIRATVTWMATNRQVKLIKIYVELSLFRVTINIITWCYLVYDYIS